MLPDMVRFHEITALHCTTVAHREWPVFNRIDKWPPNTRSNGQSTAQSLQVWRYSLYDANSAFEKVRGVVWELKLDPFEHRGRALIFQGT